MEFRQNLSSNAKRDDRRAFGVLLDVCNGGSDFSEETIAQSFALMIVVISSTKRKRSTCSSTRKSVSPTRLRARENATSSVENKVAKFWLNPPRLARSGDFGRAEIRRIELLVIDHREKAWNEFFAE